MYGTPSASLPSISRVFVTSSGVVHAACAASASQPQPRGAGGREQRAGAEGSTGEGREAGQEEEEEEQKQEQEEQEDQEEQEQKQKQQEQKQDEEEGLRTANPPATEPQSAAWRELTGEPLASPQRFFIPSYSGNWIAENGISLITVVRSAPSQRRTSLVSRGFAHS